MKTIFVKDLLVEDKLKKEIVLLCWLKSKRNHGGIIFLDLVDSTGVISAILSKKLVSKQIFDKIASISIESSVRVCGVVSNQSHNQANEVCLKDAEIINSATLALNPSPRNLKHPFDEKYVNYTLDRKHLFIRNQKISSVIKINTFPAP